MKSKLKLWPSIAMLVVTGIFASMNIVEDAEAGPRTLPPYSMTYTTAKIPLDTGSAATTKGIDSTVGPAVPFFFTGLGDYGDIEGYIYIESTIILAGDTGASAADVIDTSKDSLTYTMFTSYDYGRTVKTILEVGSLTVYTGGKSYDTVFFTLPPGIGTSGIGDNVFFNFNYAIADTSDVLGRVEAGVSYRIRIHMQPKR